MRMERLEKIGKKFNRLPEQVEVNAFDLLKKSQMGISYTGDKFSDEILRLLIELKAVEQEHELDIPKETIAAGLGHDMGNTTTAIYINFNQKKVDAANRKIIDFVNKA